MKVDALSSYEIIDSDDNDDGDYHDDDDDDDDGRSAVGNREERGGLWAVPRHCEPHLCRSPEARHQVHRQRAVQAAPSGALVATFGHIIMSVIFDD